MADGEQGPRLRRVPGNATTHGIEFEYKMAGLVALRARRLGLRFEVNTNVNLTRPLDDVVVRVRERPTTLSDSTFEHTHHPATDPGPASSSTPGATSVPSPGPTPTSTPCHALAPALVPTPAFACVPASSSSIPDAVFSPDPPSTGALSSVSAPAPHLPPPALALVQLFHGKGEIAPTDFATKGKKFYVGTFFDVFLRLRGLRTPGDGKDTKAEDEEERRFVCECAPEDMYFVVFTTRAPAPAPSPPPTTSSPPLPPSPRPSPPPSPPPPPRPPPPSSALRLPADARALFEELLRTDNGDRDTCVLSFTQDDTEVWNLREGQEDEQLFREHFLPRFFVLCGQAHADALDALLGAELEALAGGALPARKDHVRRYVDCLKLWAQPAHGVAAQAAEGVRCLTNASAEAEAQLARGARRVARLAAAAAAQGAGLTFRQDSCRGLHDALRAHRSLRVAVPGVPAGLRVAKLLQVLDKDYPSRWVLVQTEVLADFPLGALVAMCEAPSCALLAVDAEGESAERVVAAAEAAGRLVVRLTDEASAQLEDRWALSDLTPEALTNMLGRQLLFQGTRLPLGALEATWPSLRADADGALLGALARGDATLGAAPPAPDVSMFEPRALRHANVLDPRALLLHGPSFRLALSGFSRDDLRALLDRLGTDEDLAENSRWVVLSWAGEGRRAEDEEKFAAAAAREELRGRALHWLKRVDAGAVPFEHMAVVWKKSCGPVPAELPPLVRPLSERCQRLPRCVHAAQGDDEWYAAGPALGRVALLMGEPGVGKSTFLRHAATLARRQQPQAWSVFVEALAHRQLLRNLPPPAELEVKHVVELLAVAAGATAPAAQRCLEAALLQSGAVHVFVDGIDEVCPALEEKMLRVLELLIQKTRAYSIRIASRTEVQMQLQRVLHCARTFLEPLSPEAQVRFLSGVWAAQAGGRPEAFEPLAAEAVRALAGHVPGAAAASLLEVPLYSRLVAEALADDARAALSDATYRLGGLRSSLFQLYSRFVRLRRDQYLQRHGLSHANLENSPFHYDFETVHQHCAMLLLVSDGALKGVEAWPFEELVARHQALLSREKTGLLWLSDEGAVCFAHFSFVEFFAAAWLADHASSSPSATPTSAAAAAAAAAATTIVRALFQYPHALPRVRHFLEHKLTGSQRLPLHEALLADDEDEDEAALEAALAAALAAGARADALDGGGRSALHLAAARGRARAMRVLLEAGADAHRRCTLLGWDPRDYLQAALPDPRWQAALGALGHAR